MEASCSHTTRSNVGLAAEGSSACEIGDRCTKSTRVVAERAKTSVARRAQESTNSASDMVMINGQWNLQEWPPDCARPTTCCRALKLPTMPSLSVQSRHEAVCRRDDVVLDMTKAHLLARKWWWTGCSSGRSRACRALSVEGTSNGRRDASQLQAIVGVGYGGAAYHFSSDLHRVELGAARIGQALRVLPRLGRCPQSSPGGGIE
jgi:hypothetical protein